MRKSFALSLVGLLASAGGAFAGDFDFEFTAAGGTINDNTINLFPILLDDENLPGKSIPSIPAGGMQLELNGLAHTFPDDLDIFLIDPRLNFAKIMSDRGGGTDVTGIDLIFQDSFVGIPTDGGPLVDGSFRPQGLFEGSDLGLGEFTGLSGGTDQWVLLVIDDTPMDSGSLGSFTIRVVPEPATMGLLAVGAVATLIRRKRS